MSLSNKIIIHKTRYEINTSICDNEFDWKHQDSIVLRGPVSKHYFESDEHILCEDCYSKVIIEDISLENK